MNATKMNEEKPITGMDASRQEKKAMSWLTLGMALHEEHMADIKRRLDMRRRDNNGSF